MLAEAVEDLARALGWWLPEGVARWGLDVHEDGYYWLTDWWTASPCVGWQLTPIEAMLVLRCALLGPTRERCPDCKRGVQAMTRTEAGEAIQRGDYKSFSALARAGWNYDAASGDAGDGWPMMRRPCPTCTGPPVECPGPGEYYGTPVTCEGGWLQPHVVIGTARSCPECNPGNTGGAKGTIPGKPTGWVTLEHGWAERWLRAQPQECKACLGRVVVGHYDEPDEDGFHEPVLCGACEDGTDPGDPEARDQISVKADELAERGQPGCSTCEGSQLEKAGTVLGFLATGTLDAWKRSNPESEGWSVWSQPERGVMIGGGGDGVRIVCRRPCPSCASARRLGLWLALCLAGKPCGVCDGQGADIGEHGNPHEQGDCEPCHGSGLELGHHADAMADAGRALAHGTRARRAWEAVGEELEGQSWMPPRAANGPEAAE